MLIWRVGLILGKYPEMKLGEHFRLFFWLRSAFELVNPSTIPPL
jgi:hypothetical protein